MNLHAIEPTRSRGQRRVDGVEVDAKIQRDRAVKYFHTGNNVHLVEHAVGVEVEVAARLPQVEARHVRRVQQLVPGEREQREV